MTCKICNGTGKVEVSYASAENGPTSDPEDERGIEPCSCDLGHVVWSGEMEEYEKNEKAFFASMGINLFSSGDSYNPDLTDAELAEQIERHGMLG
jgi:hypothetical protein